MTRTDILALKGTREWLYRSFGTRHIKLGIPNSTNSCPVARTIRAATGTHQVVDVDYTTLNLGTTRVKLPGTVRRFARRFDDGRYPQFIAHR